MSITINGTTGIAGVDGTASAPAVQGGDSNTGVFFPAADTVAITTGGTERMRVDSSGNVGVGTTTFSQPNGVRDVVVSREATNEGSRLVAKGGPSGFTSFIVVNSGSHDNSSTHYSPSLIYTSALRFFSAPIDQEPNDGNLTERFRFGSSGQIGIGGANYGTSGQVLTSGGSGAAPSWTTAGPGFASSVVTGKSRATGTSYQNTTTGWLFVAFAGVNNGASATVGASSPGNSVLVCQSNATYTGGSFMVPPGWYYIINYSGLYFVSEGQA